MSTQATVPGQQPEVTRTGQRSLAVVIALVVLAVIASALSGPWIATGRTVPWFPSADTSERPTSLPRPDVPRFPGAGSEGLPPAVRLGARVAIVVLALVVLAVVIRAVRRRLAALARRSAQAADESAGTALPDDAIAPVLHDAVTTAEQHLADLVGPPEDAVIAAWVALEDAAGRTGVRRDPVATPTEFTVAVLDSTRADPAAIRALLALYLTARFSEHPITATDVDRARESLRVLAAGLVSRQADDEAVT